MRKKAVYPGTFDPITNGHLDVIKRAREIFDEVVVAVALSEGKQPKYELQKRIAMVNEATKHFDDVSVMGFDTLLVDFAKSVKSRIIIRGLRAVSDFEFELQMGYANSSLCNDIETIYLMPSINNSFISSSIVRSILNYNGDVSHLVPKVVLPYLK